MHIRSAYMYKLSKEGDQLCRAYELLVDLVICVEDGGKKIDTYFVLKDFS